MTPRTFPSIEDRRRYEKALRVARFLNSEFREKVGLRIDPMQKARAVLDLDADQFYTLIRAAYAKYAPDKTPTRPTTDQTRHAVVAHYLRRASS